MKNGYYWVKLCKNCDWDIMCYDSKTDQFYKNNSHIIIENNKLKRNNVYKYSTIKISMGFE